MADISACDTKSLLTNDLHVNFQMFFICCFFSTLFINTSPGQTGFLNFALSTVNK